MLVVNKLCKVCAQCKKDKKLLNRLYNSNYYLKRAGDEGLIAIHADYTDAFSLPALKNHVRKHQYIDSTAYNSAMLEKVDKDAEKGAIRRIVQAQDAVQTVIDKGFHRLEEDEITVDTNQLIRASQVKIQAEGKQKDQELKFIEMISHFASGNSKNERVYRDNANPTAWTTEGPWRRPRRPSHFCWPLIRHAPPRWADKVPP